VFRLIKPDAFHEAFLEWVRSLDLGSEGLNVVAIDGKSLRRFHEKKTFKNMLHSVAAWSVANRVILGCQSVDQKFNEIISIPELLKNLELKGAIITMEGEGDYVLAIMDNHPTLANAMREYFDTLHEEGLVENGVQHHQTSDAKHGRQEDRYYYQTPIPDSMKNLTYGWKGAKSIGQVHNITARDGKETSEIRYYLSNPPLSVKHFAEAVRAHWGVENSYNWVLDMTFKEDQSRIRKDHGPDNFALLRRFEINILSLDTSKESTRKKRNLAAWDESYLIKRLAAMI
jgi:predicted transposase YbfD/YdcC